MTPARRAFTLVEVLVALVLTGLVTTVAYAALQGGIDTRERLDRHRDHAEALTRIQGLASNALRHALPGVRGGTATFTVSRGTQADSVHWLTRGMAEPLGTTAAWSVSLWIVGDSLHLAASPVDGQGLAVQASVAGMASLRVRTLSRGTFATWVDGWPEPAIAPTAVQLTWEEAGGRQLTQVVRVGLERVP